MPRDRGTNKRPRAWPTGFSPPWPFFHPAPGGARHRRAPRVRAPLETVPVVGARRADAERLRSRRHVVVDYRRCPPRGGRRQTPPKNQAPPARARQTPSPGPRADTAGPETSGYGTAAYAPPSPELSRPTEPPAHGSSRTGRPRRVEAQRHGSPWRGTIPRPFTLTPARQSAILAGRPPPPRGAAPRPPEGGSYAVFMARAGPTMGGGGVTLDPLGARASDMAPPCYRFRGSLLSIFLLPVMENHAPCSVNKQERGALSA